MDPLQARSTYEPAIFKQLVVIGSAPDPAQARAWYQRAADLGSADAVRRLEPLAQADQWRIAGPPAHDAMDRRRRTLVHGQGKNRG